MKRVRIIRALPGYWYQNMIGTEFIVQESQRTPGWYCVQRSAHNQWTGQHIQMQDCKVIEEIPAPVKPKYPGWLMSIILFIALIIYIIIHDFT